MTTKTGNLFDFMVNIPKPIVIDQSKKLTRLLLIPKEKSGSGIDIYGYYINNQYGFLLKDIAQYTNKNLKTVQRQFLRAKKLYNSIRRKNFLEESVHYLEMNYNELELSEKNIEVDKMTTSKRTKKGGYKMNYIIILQRGLFPVLSKMSGQFNDAILHELNDFYWNSQIEKSKHFLKPKNHYNLPEFKDQKGKILKYRTKINHLVDSRAEVIIANMLYDLNISYQANLLFYMGNYKITPDFVLTGEPLTIIEYWGFKDNKEYEKTKQWKIKKYKELGWRLIEIQTDEIYNEPKLKERLRKIFTQ